MADVTSITLVPGGPAVGLMVEDQGGGMVSPSYVSWSPVAGVTIAASGNIWQFTATADAPAGQFSTRATYTGPQHEGPLDGPDLTVAITIASLRYVAA